MSSPHATAMITLRAGLLLLLVLGLIVRPALNQMGALHGMEHAAEAAAEHGHAHPGDAHDAEHDSDHAKGSHSLLHQVDAGVSFGILAAVKVLAVYLPASQVLQVELVAELRPQPSNPFRPPIA